MWRVHPTDLNGGGCDCWYDDDGDDDDCFVALFCCCLPVADDDDVCGCCVEVKSWYWTGDWQINAVHGGAGQGYYSSIDGTCSWIPMKMKTLHKANIAKHNS